MHLKNGFITETLKQNNSFENCSYLCKNKDIIYSVTEYPESYLTTRNSNLFPIHNTEISGKSPCHITIDKLRNLLYVSNYEDGSINVFSLNYNGVINELIYYKMYDKNSHIHYTSLSEDNNFLFVLDLGKNVLSAYEIIFVNSIFGLKESYSYTFPDNSSPRHFTINKNNLYIVTEKSCEIYHLVFSQNTGFSLIKNVSILPQSTEKQQNYTGCAIKFSNDNKFIYVTVRGHNSISVFNSSLKFIQNISCYGKTPRDINFDNTQNFMLCANQNSSDITVFERDKKTGHLLFKSKYPINSPACIIS